MVNPGNLVDIRPWLLLRKCMAQDGIFFKRNDASIDTVTLGGYQMLMNI